MRRQQLSAEHAQQLRDAFEPYAAVARITGRTRAAGAARRPLRIAVTVQPELA